MQMAMVVCGRTPPVAVLGVLCVEMNCNDSGVYLKCKNIIVYQLLYSKALSFVSCLSNCPLYI